ncbi:MAG: nitroreductase, partial [Rhodobacteraceae bacterium]|nr:nitroreductase [Paracoccaceae bacterium]
MTDDFQTFDRVMRARHSCRGFRPDPVPSTTIQQIVQTAQRVPTWCNAQPWQIIVTSGAQTDAFRNAMTQAAETQTAQPDLDWPQQYTGVYQERRRTCGLQLYQAVGVTRGDRVGSARQMSENYRLFGAPHVAIITSDSDLGPYGVMDCGGFVAAFAAAA